MTDNVDRAKLFAKLRQSTQAMLGIEKPTPEQQLKIDLAASLRLEIDRIIAAQLAGQPADVRELTTLNESLRSLFPPPPAETDTRYNFEADAEALAALFHRRADALERRRAANPAPATDLPNRSSTTDMPDDVNRSLATDSPEAELLPEGEEPPTQPHITLVDESPLRSHSMNNQSAEARPRKPRKRARRSLNYISPTAQAAIAGVAIFKENNK